MPVRKFRSVEDMPPPPNGLPFDPENLRIGCALSRTGMLLSGFPPSPRGVHKYRSVEEAWAAREAWEGATMREVYQKRFGALGSKPGSR